MARSASRTPLTESMAYYYSPFRKEYGSRRDTCPFCDTEVLKTQSVLSGAGTTVENEHYRWLVNWYPKFEGHTLVVPKRHVTILGDETNEEVVAREELLVLASRTLMQAYPGAGVEVFLQTGAGSESSVPHVHWHVVPSQATDPLRGFDKVGEFVTIDPEKEKVVLFPIPIKYARTELQALITQTLLKEKETT